MNRYWQLLRFGGFRATEPAACGSPAHKETVSDLKRAAQTQRAPPVQGGGASRGAQATLPARPAGERVPSAARGTPRPGEGSRLARFDPLLQNDGPARLNGRPIRSSSTSRLFDTTGPRLHEWGLQAERASHHRGIAANAREQAHPPAKYCFSSSCTRAAANKAAAPRPAARLSAPEGSSYEFKVLASCHPGSSRGSPHHAVPHPSNEPPQSGAPAGPHAAPHAWPAARAPSSKRFALGSLLSVPAAAPGRSSPSAAVLSGLFVPFLLKIMRSPGRAIGAPPPALQWLVLLFGASPA